MSNDVSEVFLEARIGKKAKITFKKGHEKVKGTVIKTESGSFFVETDGKKIPIEMDNVRCVQSLS